MGIKITAAQLGPTITRKLKEVNQGILRAVTNAAEFGKAASIKKTSDSGVVDRGLFKNSWDAKTLRNGAEIRNDCPYASVIEVGSRPHWAPFKAIYGWARRKFGGDEVETRRIARAVQRKIARSGTKPHFIAKSLLPAIKKELKRECDRIVEQVARKG